MPFIQLPGDSTGKLLETVTPAVSSSSATMHREVLTLGAFGSTDIALVNSTGGLLVAVSNPSTAVTVTNPSTAVTVTNPTTAVSLSSAMAISSGIFTLSSTPLFNLVGTSSGIAPVTTSGGLGVTILAGSGSGSTAVDVVNSPTVLTASSGFLVRSLSSGIVTLSSVHTVTATAATNPWSSVPSFNMPMASASSGNVGVFPSTGTLYTEYVFNASSSNSITVITTAPAILFGWNLGNTATSAANAVRVYNTSGATAGSTTGLKAIIPLPGGSAGAGNNYNIPQGISCTGGVTILVAQNFNASSTATNHSAGDVAGNIYYRI